MTIFILTDSNKDAKQICESHGIPWNNGNIRGTKEIDAKWINSYDKILGVHILKDDQIVWGNFSNLELWHKLMVEIKMRSS